MGKKASFVLTDEEKKILRRKKITISSLENFTINEIAELIEVPVFRAREIVYSAVGTPPLAVGFSDINALRSLGSITALLESQRQINKSLYPFQALSSSLIQELSRTNQAFKVDGMATMLANLNQKAAILGSTSQLFTDSIFASNAYQKLRITDMVRDIAMGGFYMRPDLAKMATQMAGLSDLTSLRLGSFDWTALGSRLRLENRAITATQNHFISFSSDYAALLKGISGLPKWTESFPVLTKMPTIEFSAHGNALRAISTEDEIVTETIDLLSKEVVLETKDGIELYLPRLHHGYPKMWKGALQALQSNNVDRVRHFNVSVRELFTHLFQQLAPDDSIKNWSKDEKHFYNNRPTRKARLFYICRNINGGAYEKFLAKDIAAMLELIDLFQQGTHGIEPDFSEAQLHTLQFRVESSLRFLLEIEFITNRS